MQIGLLQPGVDFIRDPFPEVAARREQRGGLDGRQLGTAFDEHSYCRVWILEKRVPKSLVRNQPPDEQLDTPLCHVSRLPLNTRARLAPGVDASRFHQETLVLSALR